MVGDTGSAAGAERRITLGHQYPTLDIADVYSVIGYYLR